MQHGSKKYLGYLLLILESKYKDNCSFDQDLPNMLFRD
jgi:hypothetical protein